MSLDLARWQFGSTSVYHFIFIPVTIGLAFLVALLQTAWYRNGDDTYRRLARFFGALLLINVAVGVVSGLIQEFEFGMNWSAYSRLVGNVFGGPLAMEGLAAFFLESTFLGIWIFGWNRLSKKAHLACIWLVAAATMLSAAFIMAANSWMQHPVGFTTNDSTHQPQLNNIWALFTNPVFLWGYTHVILASLVTGAVIMLGVSAWHLRKQHQVESFRRTAVISLVVLLPSVALALFVGSELGVVEGTYQPMKIAAAEALWQTCDSHCAFSLFQIGGGNNDETPTQIFEVPDLLSILATNHVDGTVQGLNNLNAQYQKEYGPGDYIPNVFIQYWSMRVMAYLASFVFALRAVGGLAPLPPPTRKGEMVPAHRPVGGDSALPHQYRRLDADRERPPTLDRPGPDVDQERGVTLGLGRRHLDLPRRLLPDLRRPRRGRLLVDDPLQPPGHRRRPLGQDHLRRRGRPAAPVRAPATPPTPSPSRPTRTRTTWPSSTRRSTWEASHSECSGSSSWPSSGSASSCWRGSTSGSACCTRSSGATTWSGACWSTRSGPSGTATRSG